MLCHHKAKLVKELINVQYFKLGALSGLLLCTIVLCAINSQNSVFAQHSSSIEQDLKIFGTDAILPNTYPGTDHSGVDDRTHGSKGGSDAQGTTQAEDERTTPAEEDERTTPAEEDESTTPAEEDESTTPVEEDESTTPAEEDESTTPAEEDESTTPAEEDESTTPVEEEIEGTWNSTNDSLNESGIFGLEIR